MYFSWEKREGDSVEFASSGIKIVVNCVQTKYRYANNGNFEDLLYNLTQSFGGCCDEAYYKPPLSKRSQLAFFVTNHERYARSIGQELKDPTSFRFASCYVDQCREDSVKTPYMTLIERFVNSNK